MAKAISLPTKPSTWLILAVLAILGALIFFQPYLGVIALAALMAYLFFPLYKRMTRKMKPGLAAALTLVVSIIAVIIPVGVLLVLAINQGIALASWLASLGTAPTDVLTTNAYPVVDSINAAFAPISSSPVISVEGIQAFVKDVIPAIIEGFVAIALGVAGNLPTLLVSVIVYGFLFTTFLNYHKPLFNIIGTLSPFAPEINKLYTERAGSIVKASLVGQFAISFVTAVSSALLLFLIGLHSYFLFFVIVFTILGMVPLGAGVIMIPIAIIAMITGQFWAGLWVLLIFCLVICNIDSFMRPHFMAKNARLIPALTVLAAFCGIYYFGFLGIVYGPLIVILIFTTLEMYAASKNEPISLFASAPVNKPPRRGAGKRKTVV